MKITEIPSVLCKREAKLKQVSVGNMREILAIVSDLIVEDASVLEALLANGRRRAKRKSAKRK